MTIIYCIANLHGNVQWHSSPIIRFVFCCTELKSNFDEICRKTNTIERLASLPPSIELEQTWVRYFDPRTAKKVRALATRLSQILTSFSGEEITCSFCVVQSSNWRRRVPRPSPSSQMNRSSLKTTAMSWVRCILHSSTHRGSMYIRRIKLKFVSWL